MENQNLKFVDVNVKDEKMLASWLSQNKIKEPWMKKSINSHTGRRKSTFQGYVQLNWNLLFNAKR